MKPKCDISRSFLVERNDLVCVPESASLLGVEPWLLALSIGSTGFQHMSG